MDEVSEQIKIRHMGAA